MSAERWCVSIMMTFWQSADRRTQEELMREGFPELPEDIDWHGPAKHLPRSVTDDEGANGVTCRHGVPAPCGLCREPDCTCDPSRWDGKTAYHAAGCPLASPGPALRGCGTELSCVSCGRAPADCRCVQRGGTAPPDWLAEYKAVMAEPLHLPESQLPGEGYVPDGFCRSCRAVPALPSGARLCAYCELLVQFRRDADAAVCSGGTARWPERKPAVKQVRRRGLRNLALDARVLAVALGLTLIVLGIHLFAPLAVPGFLLLCLAGVRWRG